MESNQVFVWLDAEKAPEELRPEIQKFKKGMTPTYQLMGEWMLQNPGAGLREMGAFFGYSISWLSQVTSSDMFKAYLASRMKEIQSKVTQSIPQRMEALAKVACERMEEVIVHTTDHEIIKDSFDKIMHRYGYAPNARTGMTPPGAPNVNQTNIFYLNRDDLSRARERLVNAHEPKVLEHKPEELSNSPEKISSSE